jgi:molybdenum cofactor biosynthesis enzyme MoaA
MKTVLINTYLWTLFSSSLKTSGRSNRKQRVIRSPGHPDTSASRETGGRLGFITPLTNNFCAGCNRVRVTCTGRIYMCLGQNNHIDLRTPIRESADPEKALDEALDAALFAKPERHDFAIRSPGQAPALARHMSVTGG